MDGHCVTELLNLPRLWTGRMPSGRLHARVERVSLQHGGLPGDGRQPCQQGRGASEN